MFPPSLLFPAKAFQSLTAKTGPRKEVFILAMGLWPVVDRLLRLCDNQHSGKWDVFSQQIKGLTDGQNQGRHSGAASGAIDRTRLTEFARVW